VLVTPSGRGQPTTADDLCGPAAGREIRTVDRHVIAAKGGAVDGMTLFARHACDELGGGLSSR
jgi:hypothetical protein